MTNPTNSFVRLAPDSPVERSVIPEPYAGKPTVHSIQYELLTAAPYKYTLEELIFQTHVRRLGLTKSQITAQRAKIWSELFAKSHACMRASALPKKYGWGVHYDEKGRIALYAAESPEYRAFVAGKPGDVKVEYAMRSKKA
jgi:hypothetical protein